MTIRVVDLNADVVAMRRLRAAAAMPHFIALCCVVFALLFFAIGLTGWTATLGMWAAAAAFVFMGREIERGAPWPLWLLTAATATVTVLAVGAVTLGRRDASIVERAQVAGGAILMLTPCWILIVQGWRAVPQRDAVGAIYAISGSAWRRTPRAQRTPEAMFSFGAALLVYMVGLVPAALAAVAVGGHLWVCGVVYAPIAAVAGRLWNRGRRASALGLQQVRRLDTRPPAILLRSFGDDNLPLEKRYHLFWFLFTAQETLTLEAFVVDQIWRLGPVLAIGAPTERLSPLGAAREYIQDDRWRSRIREYLAESRYVVAVLGATRGLSWEYEQIEALGREHNVLVVFPPRPADELQRRWSIFQSAFTPARTAPLQWKPFIGVPLLAFFGRDAVTCFYCDFQHETAYAAAFSRLFQVLGPS